MSNNDNKDDDDEDYQKLNNNFLSQWPIMDTLDFEIVTADVTRWDDNTYTATLNFCMPSESGEPPYSGMSLCTQISGDTIEEIHFKLSILIDSGLFDGIEIGATGIIWDQDGNEVGEIHWNDYIDDDDDDDDKEENSKDEEIDKNRILH